MRSLINGTPSVIVSGILVIAVTCFGWKIEAKNRELTAANQDLRRMVTKQKPHIIRNLDLDILPLVEPVSPDYHISAASGDERLILVASDSCAICEKQLPLWKRLVQGLPAGREVWMVSMDRGKKFSDMAGFLRSSGRPYKWLRATDLAVFVLSTGSSQRPPQSPLRTRR